VHHLLFASFLGASIPPVEHCFPGPHFAGSCKPLYAHVRDAEHGRQRTEPQECRREQELDLETVLLQQRMSKTSSLWAPKLTISQKVLFTFCAMNEIFFIALYLLSFSSPLLSPTLLGDKQIPSSIQPGSPAAPKPSMFFTSPWSAGAMEMARANKMDSTVPWILTLSSAPVMAVKQWINIVQMIKASQWLAEGDREARRQAGLPAPRPHAE
jgi:hypothetical protein